MGVEFELKFRATPEVLDAIHNTISGETVRLQMQTTYYDTPSGALSARHYTLRQRLENDRSVCTLKTPTGGIGRNEFETDCPSLEQALPILCKLSGIDSLPQLLREGIVPVCGARFTRLAKTVVLPDCTVELALDQGYLSGGGRELPLCEVEVELKEGSQAAAQAYAMQLAIAFSLTVEKHSKFSRARKLAAEGKDGYHG